MIQKYKRFTERVDDDAWEGTDQDFNDDWAGGSRKTGTPLPSRFDMSGEIADDDDFYDSLDIIYNMLFRDQIKF